MRRWWSDTLAKRLFLLMWAALVLSHVTAFVLVTRPLDMGGPPPRPPAPMAGQGPGPGPMPPPGPPPGDRGAPPQAPLPSFPSLPPTPGLSAGAPSLSAASLALDYGIRLLVIAFAAWAGARWLSRPMARLAAASTQLATALARKAPPPRLDEHGGTVEVREAARVFNRMAAQLDEQLRSRELLMAALSHDLRTPLTHLRLRLEGLAHLPEAARCIVSVQQMDALIDNSLAAFREAGQVEAERRTDVLALVQAVGDDLAEQGHAVSVRGEPLVAAVQPVALTRLLQNLAVNAVRYGGRADIEVRTEGDTIEITVDDDGPGIPPEQLEAVFQPFYRVEASRSRETGGSGLGLGIARDLVTRQGGTLTLANRAAGGLRATVRLPLR